MKILIVCDKKNSAIDRLDQSIKKFNPHFEITIQSFHPKRPNIDELERIAKLWDEADLVHVTYWKSGEKFKELYPDKFRDKRKILSHHNPYDLNERDWQKEYKRIVVSNEEMHSKIPYAMLIPQGIDLDFWEFNNDYTEDETVCMVVARIEGKKGIREVAAACHELGYKFVLVGRVSDADYYEQIKKANPDIIFKENISDEELKQTYYNSAIHVCNSIDNFESGTMPILESMACGVPILTRIVGHVPELYDGKNLMIREGQPEDLEALKTELKELMENKPLRKEMREKAWQTVKNRPAQKMAREYSKLYYEVMSDKKSLVSVIVPTFDKPDILIQCLSKIVIQDYPHLEIVVVDSGNTSAKPIIDGFKIQTHRPIKYIRFENKGEYTLAKARNLAVIEAEGKYLLFCDERIGMEQEAITTFVNCFESNPDSNAWLFGIKDEAEKGFVENFSFLKREDFIRLGMFCERIDCYGGISQEVRTRFEKNGFLFERVNAKAQSLAGSKNWKKKKEIIRSKFNIWKMYYA